MAMVPAAAGTNGISVLPCKADEVVVGVAGAVTVTDEPTAPPDSIEKHQSLKKKMYDAAGVENSEDNLVGDAPFHKLLYVTSMAKDISNNSYISKHTDSQCSVQSGRPDFEQIFAQMALLCVQESYARCAVVTCGPPSLVERVEHLCSSRHAGIVFDLHKECFEL
jgi:Ferric reductase NAD binding domain